MLVSPSVTKLRTVSQKTMVGQNVLSIFSVVPISSNATFMASQTSFFCALSAACYVRIAIPLKKKKRHLGGNVTARAGSWTEQLAHIVGTPFAFHLLFAVHLSHHLNKLRARQIQPHASSDYNSSSTSARHAVQQQQHWQVLYMSDCFSRDLP